MIRSRASSTTSARSGSVSLGPTRSMTLSRAKMPPFVQRVSASSIATSSAAFLTSRDGIGCDSLPHTVTAGDGSMGTRSTQRWVTAGSALEQQDGEPQRPQREGQRAAKRVALEGVHIGEGRRVAAEERLDRLLDESRHHQAREVPLGPAPQGRKVGEDEQADEQEEGGVPDEV